MAATQNLSIRIGSTFGPVSIYVTDAAGAAVPLAGWSAYAEARTQPAGALLLDLAPAIAQDDAAGLVTIPAIPWAATAILAPANATWELILQNPDGQRSDSVMEGALTIALKTTQPL